MTKNRDGLIINVSSIGGMMYLFNVPYGVGKAACDRMAGKTIIFHFLTHSLLYEQLECHKKRSAMCEV